MFPSDENALDNKKTLALFGKFYSSVNDESGKFDFYKIDYINEYCNKYKVLNMSNWVQEDSETDIFNAIELIKPSLSKSLMEYQLYFFATTFLYFYCVYLIVL